MEMCKDCRIYVNVIGFGKTIRMYEMWDYVEGFTDLNNAWKQSQHHVAVF